MPRSILALAQRWSKLLRKKRLSVRKITTTAPKRFASTAVPTPTANINASLLQIEKAKKLKPLPANKDLIFGHEFSDHMLDIDWDYKKGWYKPCIKPFQSLQLSPAATCLHYGLEAFEGLKAYRDKKDNIRLFRPQLNIQRLLTSCQALSLPSFDSKEFLKCLQELLKIDKRWIPTEYQYSLYIRPTIIGTTPVIGVAPAKHVKLYVILSPVGPYFREGFKAISMLATDKYVRAWPRGSGSYKIGANYGPTIRAQQEANSEGYQQIMWLLPNDADGEKYITEVGTMNQFIFWINEKGEQELITSPLDGTILPGVTRESIIQLTREWNEFKVTERPISMNELVRASRENRVLEMFGSGTGAIVCPVKMIGYQNHKLNIPLDPKNPSEQAGPLTRRLMKTILDIQHGIVEHPWSVIVS